MVAAGQLQLVLVTPEKTLLDEPVRALRLPLYDGSIGILPGRAPMIGRLGYGELKITTASGEQSYYIDGGFIQVKENVVSVLTNRAIPRENINPAEAEALMKSVSERVPTTEQAFEAKARDQERARRMLQMARGR
jgi:F-type H+-transporting ATPase subunit epsilon